MQTSASFQPIAKETIIATIKVDEHDKITPSVAPESAARWVDSVERNDVKAPVELSSLSKYAMSCRRK